MSTSPIPVYYSHPDADQLHHDQVREVLSQWAERPGSPPFYTEARDAFAKDLAHCARIKWADVPFVRVSRTGGVFVVEAADCMRPGAIQLGGAALLDLPGCWDEDDDTLTANEARDVGFGAAVAASLYPLNLDELRQAIGVRENKSAEGLVVVELDGQGKEVRVLFDVRDRTPGGVVDSFVGKDHLRWLYEICECQAKSSVPDDDAPLVYFSHPDAGQFSDKQIREVLSQWSRLPGASAFYSNALEALIACEERSLDGYLPPDVSCVPVRRTGGVFAVAEEYGDDPGVVLLSGEQILDLPNYWCDEDDTLTPREARAVGLAALEDADTSIHRERLQAVLDVREGDHDPSRLAVAVRVLGNADETEPLFEIEDCTQRGVCEAFLKHAHRLRESCEDDDPLDVDPPVNTEPASTEAPRRARP